MSPNRQPTKFRLATNEVAGRETQSQLPEVKSQHNFLKLPKSPWSPLCSSGDCWRRWHCRSCGKVVTDFVNEASLAPKEEHLLRGVVVGGGDAEERLWSPRAPEVEAPQVGGLVASLRLVGVDADECRCWPLGSEAPDEPPVEPLQAGRGELFRHLRRHMDLELEVVHHAQRVAGARQGLFPLIVFRLSAGISCLAGNQPLRGPLPLAGGRVRLCQRVWGV